MGATKHQNRRIYSTVAIILVVALCGMVMMSVGDTSADNSSLTALQNKNGENAVMSAQPESPYGAIVRMIAALVVVIACIYGGLFLLSRQMKRRRYGKAGGGSLDVLETAFVGPKKTVSLVRVADRAVLIGVTDNQISVLTELSEPETARLLAEQSQPSQEAFGTMLGAAFGHVKKLGERGKEALARA